MKIIALAALLTIGFAGASYAQTTTSGALSGSQSGATAIVVNGAAGAGPAGAAAAATVGGLANPQIIAGQSTVGPSVTAYDSCSKTRSGSLPFGFGAGWTAEMDLCWNMRLAEFVKNGNGPGTLGYELACQADDKRLVRADRILHINACSENRTIVLAEAIKASRNAKTQVQTQTVAAYAPPANCRTVPGTTALTCN